MTDDCPTQADLQAFNWGNLPEDRIDGIAAHVEVCPTCEQLLADLERRADPVEAVLRAGTARDAAPLELPAFIGPYEVLGELGRGGMSVVYRARHTGLGRAVALKMLLGGCLADAEQRARFRGEAAALARLTHPNIVCVYDVGEYVGVPFFTLELVEGGNLGRWLAGKPQPAPAAARWLQTLARAVQYAHEQGVVHRDLKPANILLGSGAGPDAGALKIADFGVAKLLEGSSVRTASGHVLGTPEYMAPEQYEASAPVGPAIDVYALGAVLYVLLTGRPPFQASNAFGTVLLVRTGDPLPPAQLAPGVPRDLETICLKCLAKEPGQRYATAGHLADDLGRFLDGRPIHARPVGPVGRLGRWCRRRPDLAGLLAALVVVVAAGFAGLSRAYLTTEAARRAEAGQRQAAQRAQDAAENNLYHSRVVLADRALQANDVAAARRLLEQCRPAPGEPDRRSWEWHYVDRLCHAALLTLEGHDGQVYAVAFSSDGRLLASAAGNPYAGKAPDGTERQIGEVILWDAATGARLRTLRGHECLVKGVAFSPDGKTLASSCPDGTVELWEVATGRAVATLSTPGFGFSETSVRFSRDGKRVVRIGEQSAAVWDVATGKEVATFAAAGAAYSPAGLLAGLTGEGHIQVWDEATGKLLHTISGGGGLGLSPDGTLLASSEPTVGWRSLTGDDRWTRLPTTNQVVLHFSPDGRFLVSHTPPAWLGMEVVTVYDVRAGQVRHQLRQNGGVMGLAFSDDGARLAVASSDHAVRVWDLASGAQQAVFLGHTHVATGVAFQPGGRRLASASVDGTVRVWDLTHDPRGRLAKRSQPAGGEYLAALAWRGGQLLAAYVRNCDLVVFDAATGAELARHPLDLTEEHFCPRRDVAFSADGRLLAGPSKGDVRVVKVWDTADGREVAVLPRQAGPVRAVAFRPDGRCLATADRQATPAGVRSEVRLWDPRSGQELASLGAVGQPVSALAFSPDGRTLASTRTGDGTVLLQDPDSGAERRVLPGCRTPVHLAFSPDGGLLAAADFSGGRLRTWRTATGEEVFAVPCPGAVTGVTFSPDGRRVVTAGYDGTVRFWDAATGQDSLMLRGRGALHPSDYAFTAQAVFSPDGTRLAGNTWNGQVNVWDAGPRKEE